MRPVVLQPGTLRWGQQVALLFEPPRQAMRRWADWVVKTHGSRTSLAALDGWMDASPEYKTTEKDVSAIIDTVKNHKTACGRARSCWTDPSILLRTIHRQFQSD